MAINYPGKFGGGAFAGLGLLGLVLLLIPAYGFFFDQTYLILFVTRILIFALAAVGLNLALGYCGLISFGHALYFGLGAYVVAVFDQFGIHSGWIHLIGVVVVMIIVALVLGSIALRTRGIAFIMITLAFAQLFFFVFVSLKNFGGDEGITLNAPSAFGRLTGSRNALYYAALFVVVLAVYLTYRVVNSRFGLIINATMVNERRVRAVGINTLPYLLVAYVISAVIVGIAGFLLVNSTGFVSPAYMAWTVSGELIVMVVLGGVGTVVGPVLGAAILLSVEEILRIWTDYPMIFLGPLIIVMVLMFRDGFLKFFEHSRSNSASLIRPVLKRDSTGTGEAQ